MLTIKNVTKKYGEKTALSGFSMEMEKGIIGLLGANGAGKSTLMKMIATVAKPTSGQIYWKGKNIHEQGDELRRELGYLPQDFGAFPNLSAVEFLTYVSALKGMSGRDAKKRIHELLDILNLSDAAKRPIGGYSGGMRQRVGIAQALLNDPKLLIVDEPTVGLDPTERLNFRNLMSHLAQDRIILLSTHIVSDVEASAEQIALVSKGRLVSFTKGEELVNSIEGNVWECNIQETQVEQLRSRFITGSVNRKNGQLSMKIISEHRPTENAVPVSAGLEDAYLYYTADRGGENHERA